MSRPTYTTPLNESNGRSSRRIRTRLWRGQEPIRCSETRRQTGAPSFPDTTSELSTSSPHLRTCSIPGGTRAFGTAVIRVVLCSTFAAPDSLLPCNVLHGRSNIPTHVHSSAFRDQTSTVTDYVLSSQKDSVPRDHGKDYMIL